MAVPLSIRRALALSLVMGLGGASSCESPSHDESGEGVTIDTDATTYAPTDIIRVSIRNDLPDAITTVDQRSQCTIVWLERHDGDAWTPTLGCTLNTPSQETTYGPSTETTIAVAPHPSLPDAQPPPGRYRATLIYTVGPRFEPRSSATDTASSSPFVVE